MAEEKEWQEGMPTHEDVIFSCFGGFSNTGITSALACLEAVKELTEYISKEEAERTKDLIVKTILED
ncbi:hypothetical protein E3J48_06710 [Candidatus Aerophobetes bacterium]|uniref:Uncharacterized protein n=1 Tax=Aerophobetes bacterium TaxID=2030807 RepID=A0A523W0B4_UNCAE|nr:MAG: hypothetical protein E3J48_06710 [Candidatus Aerophobetes bacterium]